MEIILPDTSTKNMLNSKKKEVNTGSTNYAFVDDFKHEFFICEDYKDFESKFCSIEQNTTYHIVSFGQWSLKHIIFHILRMIGSADVLSTTYGLGPSSARGIVSALKAGMIKSFNFIYDWKIKQYKEEAHYLCESNFPVKITSIHAKVTVLINSEWGITVTGSPNWSDKNSKIETIVITTHRKLATFHKNWILQTIECNATEPKTIIKNIKI